MLSWPRHFHPSQLKSSKGRNFSSVEFNEACQKSRIHLLTLNYRGALKGRGKLPPNRQIVVEKWCYFPELYKLTKVLEDRREHGKKSIFYSDFGMYILKFSQKFQTLIGFLPRRAKICRWVSLFLLELLKIFNNPPSSP